MQEKTPRSKTTPTWPDGTLLKDIKAVALLLGDKHINTIYNWVADGKIECIRTPGNKIMFTYDQIQDFINGHRERSTVFQTHMRAA